MPMKLWKEWLHPRAADGTFTRGDGQATVRTTRMPGTRALRLSAGQERVIDRVMVRDRRVASARLARANFALIAGEIMRRQASGRARS
jgi:hypothetical protein